MRGSRPAVGLLQRETGLGAILFVPEQGGNVTDRLHQLGIGLLTDLLDHGLLLVPIPGIDTYLHQFMMFQRYIDFIDNRLGESVLSGEDDRLEAMGLLA